MSRPHGPCTIPASEISKRAATWLIRVDAGATPEDWYQLNAWLDASPRHRAAFLRLSVAWDKSNALKHLSLTGEEPEIDLLAPYGRLASRNARRETPSVAESPHTRRDAVKKLGYSALAGAVCLAFASPPGGFKPEEGFLIGALGAYLCLTVFELVRVFIDTRRHGRPL